MLARSHPHAQRLRLAGRGGAEPKLPAVILGIFVFLVIAAVCFAFVLIATS